MCVWVEAPNNESGSRINHNEKHAFSNNPQEEIRVPEIRYVTKNDHKSYIFYPEYLYIFFAWYNHISSI